MNEYKWKSHIARFLSAQTISLLGSSIVQYAIIWYITLTTSSGKMITLSTLCGFLPQILISLFAGVWIDRYSRKGIVMITDCLIASATLILAIFFSYWTQEYRIAFSCSSNPVCWDGNTNSSSKHNYPPSSSTKTFNASEWN